MKSIEIKRIDESFSSSLAEMVSECSDEYLKYFTPFEFTEKKFREILSIKKQDQYYGVFIDNELSGFYMLRGFDEGYEIPAYGVLIAEKASNYGLGKLTLQHAIAFCKASGIKKIMLKVHPDNLGAKHIYEDIGFTAGGMDEKNKNLIYYKNL